MKSTKRISISLAFVLLLSFVGVLPSLALEEQSAPQEKLLELTDEALIDKLVESPYELEPGFVPALPSSVAVAPFSNTANYTVTIPPLAEATVCSGNTTAQGGIGVTCLAISNTNACNIYINGTYGDAGYLTLGSVFSIATPSAGHYSVRLINASTNAITVVLRVTFV